MSFTSSQSIQQKWSNIRISADFVADYFLTLMPDELSKERMTEIKNTVSYVGNELLENAMKFNKESKHCKVQFGIRFPEDTEQVTAVFFTKNSVTFPTVKKFKAFIQELLCNDSQELYVQQIEKTTADEYSGESGLGLLSLINDYSAKLGWKFESEPSTQITIVTTMAQIIV
ncbi:MAG: ATP-binding protein [Rhizonema sp. PD38]|nr:ATP-binding protein [Rhizonema sp. PD38]